MVKTRAIKPEPALEGFMNQQILHTVASAGREVFFQTYHACVFNVSCAFINVVGNVNCAFIDVTDNVKCMVAGHVMCAM